MILQVYTVRDDAVNAYMQPFYARSRGEAIRSFTELANDPKTKVGQSKTDFHLFYHGEFDDVSGVFACDLPARVISATEVAQSQ